uniref:hypothetical protein n=1 Tax=Flavobacterium sp. TaxID=239 RepID=UPI004049BF78
MRKYVLFYVLFACFSISIQAQFDKNKTFKPLKLENKTVEETKKPTAFPSIDFEESIDIKQPVFQTKTSLFEKQESKKSILEETNDFKNPGDEIMNRLNNRKSDKAIDESFKSNQFLGKFESKSKYIKIVCRDHEYPDGDKVRILINDRVVISEILLESASKEYYLDLGTGFNKIEFEALNQGTSGPNTAAFRVYDDKGGVITGNQWNLTTGVKAIVVIVKEQPEEKSE